jgi:cobalamin biosynthesis Mg chelatase CobN
MSKQKQPNLRLVASAETPEPPPTTRRRKRKSQSKEAQRKRAYRARKKAEQTGQETGQKSRTHVAGQRARKAAPVMQAAPFEDGAPDDNDRATYGAATAMLVGEVVESALRKREESDQTMPLVLGVVIGLLAAGSVGFIWTLAH